MYQLNDGDGRDGEEDFLVHHSDSEDSRQSQEGDPEEMNGEDSGSD